MIEKIAGLFLFALPLTFHPQVGVSDAKEVMFLVCGTVLGLLSMSISRIRLRSPLIAFPAIWASICLLLMPQYHLKINGVGATNFWAWKPVSFWLAGTMVVAVVSSMILSNKKEGFFLNCFLASVWINIAYAGLQFFGIDVFFTKNLSDPNLGHVQSANITGLMGHPTLLAPYLVSALPFALIAKRYTLFLCASIVVFMCWSVMGFVAMGAAAMTWIYFKQRTVFSLIVFVAILGALLYPKEIYSFVNDQSSGRVAAWQDMAKDFTKSPVKNRSDLSVMLFGQGPGSMKYSYGIRKHSFFTRAHNEPLEYIYSFGFVGAVAVIFAFIPFLNTITRIESVQMAAIASAVSLLMASLGTFIFQNGAMLFLACFLIGLLQNQTFYRKRTI